MKRWLLFLLFSAMLALVIGGAKGQQAARKAPAPPKKVEAPQPVLAWVYPAGGQQGTTVEVIASGAGIEPDSVLVTGGDVSAKVLESKTDARGNNQIRIAVTIAANAQPGMREFRILNAGGVSNRFRFVVGDLPEIKEIEPNNEKSAPQILPALPVVVNGQITDGDRDYFRFHATAGETLVLEVQARSLLPYIADAVPGWFDPVLNFYDATGRQIQSADDFRFKPDPVAFFRAPKDGDYTVELRDVIFRGRGDFVYRLKIGAFPYVTDIFPMGGQRGRDIAVDLCGVNLAASRQMVRVPDDGSRKMTVAGLPFAISDLPAVAEREPNDTFEKAQRVTPPVAIEGRIQKPGDVDWFAFTANKNDKLVLEVQARRLDSPLDSILTLYDARHQQVAENDDWNDTLEGMVTHQADSRLLYTFPTAGDYYLRLRDVQGKGGEEYGYRLLLAPPRPDFTLRIAPDNPRMGQGDTAAITVAAVRKDDFSGEIKLAVQDLPAGFVSSEALIPAGQAEGRLTITAPPDAPLGVVSPTIIGMAEIGKDTVMHKAESSEALMQAFSSTHVLPTKQLFLAVIPAAGFTLASDIPPGQVLEVKPASDTPITVKVLRKPGIQAGVTITAVRLANNTISTKGVFVAPEKDDAIVTLSVAKDAKVGLRQDVIISGLMRVANQSIMRFTQAIPVRVVQ
jgi:hypothetical protein